MLFAAYAATGAPGVTFWDSGEFIAAAASWGIPHPPGTPLYVTIARAWVVLFGAVPAARAVNLLSACATALAGGALAWLVARSTGRAWMGLAAGLCAGGMSTVWSSATETEAYASALLLAMAMLLAARRAGAGEHGGFALTAYLLALAVPMHLSALVAAPAAVMLAAQAPDGEWRRADAAFLLGLAVAAAGVGRASAAIAAAGAGIALFAAWRAPRDRRAAFAGAAGGALLALSAVAILMLRARHDPALNSYAPATWERAWGVIGRRAYGSFALWPRNAPLWLQGVQFLEYMDWQPALGLAPQAAPTVARTACTLLFVALGVTGAAAHRALDRATWRAFAVLFAGASVGLVLYLNFYPGYSLGYGILAPDATHEVRERDYFFVLAFWTWGAWAGIGAVRLAARWRARMAPAGVLLAALPLVLNWRAMDRARGAEGMGAPMAARALLWGAPPRTLLLTGGDDDTFLSWYLQIAEGARRDVTVFPWAYPYLDWYREQLARRDSIVVDTAGDPVRNALAAARARGRPVAMSVGTDSATRGMLGGRWMLRGLTFVAADSSALSVGAGMPLVDTAAARAFVREFGVPAVPPSGGIDQAPRVWMRMMGCPARYLALARGAAPEDSLDSACKLR